MKAKLITLFITLLFNAMILLGLEIVPPPTKLSCIVSNTRGCNASKQGSENIDVQDSLSCIYYSYNDSTKVLSISRINAGFNCCMKQVICSATINFNELKIVETEKGKICKCNCLYSFDVEIFDVDAKKYQLKLVEPLVGNQTALSFELDLTKNKKGSFCEERNRYPWR